MVITSGVLMRLTRLARSAYRNLQVEVMHSPCKHEPCKTVEIGSSMVRRCTNLHFAPFFSLTLHTGGLRTATRPKSSSSSPMSTPARDTRVSPASLRRKIWVFKSPKRSRSSVSEQVRRALSTLTTSEFQRKISLEVWAKVTRLPLRFSTKVRHIAVLTCI